MEAERLMAKKKTRVRALRAQMDIEDVIASAPPPESGRADDILYDSLVLSDAVNVRAGDYRPEGIDELAALIRAKGLILPLAVRRAANADHLWEVVDGGRRYVAICRLIEAGHWPKDRRIPCIVRQEDDATARETSLVANISREPMHPVREMEVFAELHSAGADVATIAQRYGVSEKLVRQRLALGSLAPEIRHAWRNGKVTTDTAQAFAVCPGVATQMKVFRELSKRAHFNRYDVRGMLSGKKPRLDDARLDFIGGLDAYRKAGGVVVESLFANDGYLEDGELLDALVSTRISAKCEELVANGWGFAIPQTDVKGESYWSWARVRPAEADPTPKERKRLEKIDAEQDRLSMLDELDDEQAALSDRLTAERAAIEGAIEARSFSEAQKKKSGCVVGVDGITYGVIRPKAAKAGKGTKVTTIGVRGDDDGAGDAAAGPDDGHQEDEDAGAPRISNALLMNISERQTVAAAKTLAASPAVALLLAVAGLRSIDTAPVKISSQGWHGARGAIDDTGHINFGEALDELVGKDLTEELARELSRTLDLRRYAANDQVFGHKCDTEGIAALVAELPGETYLAEMRAEFGAGDFFHRSPAAVIRAAIAEMTGGKRELGEKVKKAELVAIATELAGPTGWLPEELRHPDYKLKHRKNASDAAPGVKGKRKKAA
jgi:ParB family chromosome partitioning protein